MLTVVSFGLHFSKLWRTGAMTAIHVVVVVAMMAAAAAMVMMVAVPDDCFFPNASATAAAMTAVATMMMPCVLIGAVAAAVLAFWQWWCGWVGSIMCWNGCLSLHSFCFDLFSQTVLKTVHKSLAAAQYVGAFPSSLQTNGVIV